MTLSVALCTYHGAPFLAEQLESLRAQTRLPDELVVCDDASQDDTVAVLQKFAAVSPFPVRLTVNDRTLGSTANFQQAIRLCQGELIALCDQDDVWLPDKLARLEAVLAASPDTGLVFSDAVVVDQDLCPTGQNLWAWTGFIAELQRRMSAGQAFDVELMRNYVTGCTMLFRSALREYVLPIPHDILLIHDGWIALIAAAVSRVEFISTPLLQYRQHPGQQLGTAALHERRHAGSREHFRAHLRQLQTVRTRLCILPQERLTIDLPKALRIIDGQIAHLQVRLALSKMPLRRVSPILRELLTGHYHRYSNGFSSVAWDLLMMK